MNTVKIRTTPCEGNEEGSIIINEADFNPEVHELFDAPPAAASGTPNFHKMNKTQLQAHLDAAGVGYETDANKARLIELCEENAE